MMDKIKSQPVEKELLKKQNAAFQGLIMVNHVVA